MKIRLLPLALIAALLLAFGVMAAACGDDDDGGNGGGGGLTIEEYFQKLAQMDDEYDQRTDTLEEKFDEDVASADSEEDALEVTRDFFAGGVQILKDFVDDIDDLNPPAEVEQAHNQAVDSGQTAVEAFEDLVGQLDDAESDADLIALFSESDFEVAGAEFEQACLDMQDIADENEIDIDLDCGT